MRVDVTCMKCLRAELSPAMSVCSVTCSFRRTRVVETHRRWHEGLSASALLPTGVPVPVLMAFSSAQQTTPSSPTPRTARPLSAPFTSATVGSQPARAPPTTRFSVGENWGGGVLQPSDLYSEGNSNKLGPKSFLANARDGIC